MSDTEQSVAAPDEEAQVMNESGDSPTEIPEVEEAAVEEPKFDEEVGDQVEDEGVDSHPPAEDMELSVSNIVPSEVGTVDEESASKAEDTANEDLGLEPVEGDGGVEVTSPQEVAAGDGDDLMLAPVDVEQEDGEEGEEGEGKEDGVEGETEEQGAGEEGEGKEGEHVEGDKVEEEEKKEDKTDVEDEHKIKKHRLDSLVGDAPAPEVAGDFVVRADSSTEAFAFDQAVASSSSSEEEIEEEEIIEEVEEEELQIDREQYIETYRQLLQERTLLKRKNALLQKKLVEHYKKRKMENVYKDVLPNALDLEPKYAKKLQAYDEMRTIEERERFLVNTDLKEMKTQRDALAAEVAQDLDALVQKERETGTGLINAKTGKPIPDKLIERFLRRQQNKCKDIAKCRLAFIKLRDKVNLKETALKDLETLGDNLHLIDYEQLRMENQNLCDKIEERDDELTRLRGRTTQCIQVLAHVREKLHATLADIETQKESLTDVEEEVVRTREELNQLKRRRDTLREETRRNQEDAGLLTRPKLLRDFEESIALVGLEQEKLRHVQVAFAEEAKALQMARTSLVEVEEEYRQMRAMTSRRNAGRKATLAGAAQHFQLQERRESLDQRPEEVVEEEESIFQMK